MLGDVDKSGTLRFNLANNANLYVTGDLAMLQSVLEGLSSSQIESTLISLAVSFLVLFLLTRRIMPAIVILFPVGIASLWVVGSMAVIGLKWNVLTVKVTALTLGIGIDYSIHMWRRFEVELKRRNNHWDALRASISTTGHSSSSPSVRSPQTLGNSLIPSVIRTHTPTPTTSTIRGTTPPHSAPSLSPLALPTNAATQSCC